MRVLVIAPLRAPADHALDEPWKRPVRFAHATFEQTMANVGPHVVLDHKTRAERRFVKLADFAEKSTPVGGASLLDDILSATEGDTDGRPSLTRALERAWRGLAFLCAHAPEEVTIEAIDARHDDVDAVLQRVATTPGEEPLDLIVVDHPIEPSARDLERVLRWAELGEGAGAPVICEGTPALVGLDDLAALARTERRLRSTDDPRAVRFRAVTAKEPMRWISLALNGAAEASAPLLLASLAVASAAKTGWLAGLERTALEDVTLEADVASETAADEAAAAGLTLVVPGVRVLRAPVAHREPSRSGGGAAAATLGLSDQLFLARVYRLVQELGSAIPSGTAENVVRETALVALSDLFSEASGPKPSFDIAVTARGLEVTVRPRGFAGVTLEEATLGSALG